MITNQRDTDELVLRNMDDGTLMNTMKTNKTLLKMGEEIFRERLKKAYPYLYERKPFLESYRHYYLKMMYYLGKLKEEFNVDYIPAPSFDPEALYRGSSSTQIFFLNNPLNVLKRLVPFYAEIGDENKLLEIGNMGDELVKGESRMHILENLVRYRHVELFEKFANLWDFDVNNFFSDIIQSGDKNIVKYFLNKYDYIDPETNHEEGLIGAAKIGSMEMFEYVNELFPESEIDKELFVLILEKAAVYGQVNFLRNFLVPENQKFLMKNLPRIVIYFVISREIGFLSENRAIEILDLLLDYYLKNGGTKEDFSEKAPFGGKTFLKNINDPIIAKYIKRKLGDY